MSKKVLYYLNQFFSQIGGEDQAGIAPQFKKEPVGPATAFAKGIKNHGEFAGTLICGDNFFNEHNKEALEFLEMIYHDVQPDLVIAGPAFNAGRYGMACAGVAEFFNEKGVPVISGMYEENPGLETSRINAYVIPTSDSAASMRKALPAIIKLACKVLSGEKVEPEKDGYFTQGIRLTVLSDKIGAKRAVDMLLKRLKNEEFETELPMPEFDKVDPAPAVADLSKATIALVTTGGIVPKGNPDHLQSASAQKWVKYDVSKLDSLGDDYYTVHGGFDPVYCNELPDRVAPLDQLRQFEKSGYIGKVYDFFYSTTGTGTAVGNSEKFGREMGQELKVAGVDAVILTST